MAEESVTVYQCRITRQVPNPKYQPDSRYRQYEESNPFVDQEALSVMISQKQFEAIRKAVLEVF